MLASRSGETVELIAVVVLVTYYLSPCLSRTYIHVLVAHYCRPCLETKVLPSIGFFQFELLVPTKFRLAQMAAPFVDKERNTARQGQIYVYVTDKERDNM